MLELALGLYAERGGGEKSTRLVCRKHLNKQFLIIIDSDILDKQAIRDLMSHPNLQNMKPTGNMIVSYYYISCWRNLVRVSWAFPGKILFNTRSDW